MYFRESTFLIIYFNYYKLCLIGKKSHVTFLAQFCNYNIKWTQLTLSFLCPGVSDPDTCVLRDI